MNREGKSREALNDAVRRFHRSELFLGTKTSKNGGPSEGADRSDWRDFVPVDGIGAEFRGAPWLGSCRLLGEPNTIEAYEAGNAGWAVTAAHGVEGESQITVEHFIFRASHWEPSARFVFRPGWWRGFDGLDRGRFYARRMFVPPADLSDDEQAIMSHIRESGLDPRNAAHFFTSTDEVFLATTAPPSPSTTDGGLSFAAIGIDEVSAALDTSRVTDRSGLVVARLIILGDHAWVLAHKTQPAVGAASSGRPSWWPSDIGWPGAGAQERCGIVLFKLIRLAGFGWRIEARIEVLPPESANPALELVPESEASPSTAFASTPAARQQVRESVGLVAASASREPGGVSVIAVAIGALVVACSGMMTRALLHGGNQGYFYDAAQYFSLSQQILQGGLFAYQSEVRTYGYPLFLALCAVLSLPTQDAVWTFAVVVQWVLYMLACGFAARHFARLTHSRTFGLVLFAVTALNPYLLIDATEVLTESLSATTLYLAIVLCLPESIQLPLNPIRAIKERFGRTRSRRDFLPEARLVVSLAMGSFAVMVRPANLVMLAPLFFLWGIRWLFRSRLRWWAVPVVLVAFLLPLYPQAASNYRFDKRLSIMIRRSLYEEQLRFGLGLLKYGTFVIRGQPPQLNYVNTLLPKGTVERPPVLSATFPAYLATLGVHLFALFDQDYPFTYVTDRAAWHRWPSSILSFSLTFLAACGAWGSLARLRTARALDSTSFAFSACLLAAVAYVSVYAGVAVEGRFGHPLYLFLAPLMVFEVQAIGRHLAARNWKQLSLVAVLGAVSLIAWLALSRWLEIQNCGNVETLGRYSGPQRSAQYRRDRPGAAYSTRLGEHPVRSGGRQRWQSGPDRGRGVGPFSYRRAHPPGQQPKPARLWTCCAARDRGGHGRGSGDLHGGWFGRP